MSKAKYLTKGNGNKNVRNRRNDANITGSSVEEMAAQGLISELMSESIVDESIERGVLKGNLQAMLAQM